MPIPLGAPVRQKIKPIEGVVAERRFNESADQMEYLVVSTDAQGVDHTRYMLESDIEQVGE